MKQLFPGVFSFKGKILTKNLIPKQTVYGERLFKIKKIEYREWIPFRSKLCAAIKNGLKEFPIKRDSKILYLGVAEGTSASHLSDIVEENGLIFGVDVSERTMKKLLHICESRENILPLLADASKPEEYADELKAIEFDLLYQDVSQKNQVQIFKKNAARFLPKNAFGMLALKAKSISSTAEMQKIFQKAEEELAEDFEILQKINLKPFEKDHIFYLLKKK